MSIQIMLDCKLFKKGEDYYYTSIEDIYLQEIEDTGEVEFKVNNVVFTVDINQLNKALKVFS